MPPNFDQTFEQVKQLAGSLNINEIYLSVQGESTFAGLPCIFIRLTACNLRCSYCDTAYAFTQGRKMTLPEITARIDELASPFRGAHVPIPNRDAAGCAQQPVMRQPWVAGTPRCGVRSAQRADPTSSFAPITEALPRPASPTAVNPLASGLNLPLVELTGGEPLLQKNSLPLMKSLCDAGYTVLLETSGALDIGPVDPRVHRIMDLKCPSSGEVKRNRWQNLPLLKPSDEIKFVIGTAQDYDWAREQLAVRQLAKICPVLFSWVSPLQPHQQDKSLKKVPAGQTALSRRQLVEKIIADALPVRFQLQMHKFIWPPGRRGV